MSKIQSPSYSILCFACLGFSLACPAIAREPGAGNAYSQGSSIGLPTGANPPEGVWFEDTSSVYVAQATDTEGTTKNGTKITAISTAPRILWTTPWKFLGATEMAFVVMPIVNLDVSNIPGQSGVTGHSLAFANPEFVPINLSWNLGIPGLFGSATFGFYPPIGRYSSNATVNIGDNFWTFQPEAALSYISPRWVLSVHFLYNTNTEDKATDYTSGDQLFVDLTALHNFGKWSVGPVAYYTKQVTPDKNQGTYYGADHPLYGEPGAFAPGLLVGYKAGKVQLAGYFTHDVVASQGGDVGTRVYFRVMFPFS
ncbi:SphA family protein [Acidocella sp.]|uniref:SphA family protein n=1 Tax=Acidocella sp. TaxID=50710 RepID=UPI003CFD1DF5